MELSFTLDLTSLSCKPGVMLTHAVERIKGDGMWCPTCPWPSASPRLLWDWNPGLSLPALGPVPSITSLPEKEERGAQHTIQEWPGGANILQQTQELVLWLVSWWFGFLFLHCPCAVYCTVLCPRPSACVCWWEWKVKFKYDNVRGSTLYDGKEHWP